MSTEAKPQRANGRHRTSEVVLIASNPPADAITRILSADGTKVEAFARIEDVTDRTDQPAAVVTWAQDPSSSASLAQIVSPLTQLFDAAPLIVVCEGIERWGVRAALASGASGVVLYDQLAHALGPCLQAVIAGQACVPQAHSRQIEPPALSTREKQILGLVVMGYMNSQIAERLYLAESTVKSHLSSAFGKLGVRSRNEAVRLIVNPDNGLGLGILGLGGERIGPSEG